MFPPYSETCAFPIFQDVKYKTQEYKGLEKTVAEISEDRTTSQSELSAVNEYYAKLQARVVQVTGTLLCRVRCDRTKVSRSL